ncbi:MAG: RNase adapter RapZ [Alphaproteobacteria bacterium]|nr:RNase adapter RapZ [Alphaproteobacteria bacterium]MCB9931169.1 RNase adapter RapZ [Alphaproteobacteria bacterium]
MQERSTERQGGRQRRLVLLTGLSGAGKTTALKAFEDIGFDAIDNLPFRLLAPLLHDDPPARLAIGVDARTRGFDPAELLALRRRLVDADGWDVALVYLDCDDDTMLRRFTETRRRHPLSDLGGARDGVARERELLAPLRSEADRVLDTSLMTARELKRWVAGGFESEGPSGLAVQVVSFSFRQGLPREADLVFDVRFLANPHYQPDLRPLTGRDAPVADYIRTDPGLQTFLDLLQGLTEFALPRYEQEGKSYLTLAIGCTGGRHRSVFVAEQLAAMLQRQGWTASVRHRELGIG